MNIVSACVNHLRHVLQLSARVRLDADEAGQATRPRLGSGRGVVDRTAAPLRFGIGGAPEAMDMSESEVSSAHDLTGFGAPHPLVQPVWGGAFAGAIARRSSMR